MPLVTPRLPGARGQLSLALNREPPALLDCIGTRGAVRAGWPPTVDSLRGWRGPGARKALPLAGLFTQVAVLLST